MVPASRSEPALLCVPCEIGLRGGAALPSEGSFEDGSIVTDVPADDGEGPPELSMSFRECARSAHVATASLDRCQDSARWNGFPFHRRRHRHQHPIEERHHVGAADLRSADLPKPEAPGTPRPALHDWLVAWIDRDIKPAAALESLPGVLWHLRGAWARRRQPNIELIHYDDLATNLAGEMHRIAARLGIQVPAEAWADLVLAATFDQMRARAGELVHDQTGVLKNPAAFFRRGTSGAGRELLTGAEFTRYLARVRQLAARDLLAWLHRRDPEIWM